MGNVRAAWVSLLIPDRLYCPGNTFSICQTLNLADATRTMKTLVWMSWGINTEDCFFPLPCVGKMYLLTVLSGCCSQMECSTCCLVQHRASRIPRQVGFIARRYRTILPSCLVSKKQLSLGTPACAGTSEGQGRNSECAFDLQNTFC